MTKVTVAMGLILRNCGLESDLAKQGDDTVKMSHTQAEDSVRKGLVATVPPDRE